jgi:hypothetical protein
VKSLPDTDVALVLRTDFSNAGAWLAVRKAIREAMEDIDVPVQFVSDSSYSGLSPEQIFSLVAPESNRAFLFVADEDTLSRPGFPILVMDLHRDPVRTFRAIPPKLPSIHANLWLANMDFEEYADSVDPDGVFRGFGDK